MLLYIKKWGRVKNPHFKVYGVIYMDFEKEKLIELKNNYIYILSIFTVYLKAMNSKCDCAGRLD